MLRHLKERGLADVQLLISDTCMGLKESVADYYPVARWKRCVVHFYRNVFSHVPNTKANEVTRMLKAIHAQESLQTARSKTSDVIASLKAIKLPKAAQLLHSAIDETLTYYLFPDNHWIRIRTKNPLERIIREI